MAGPHFDNGVEFINKPLIEWRLERNIKTARSRPYKKNDNAAIAELCGTEKLCCGTENGGLLQI